MKPEAEKILELLEQRGPQLYALMLRITLREDATDDLMQELFLRLARPKVLRRAKNLSAYATRAAVRLAFDWRRSQHRRPDRSGLATEPIDNGSPVAGLQQREDLQGLLADMDRLSKNARDAVVMRYLQELSYEEIGSILDKTPHQTRALCHKAIVRLRKMQATVRHERAVPNKSGDDP